MAVNKVNLANGETLVDLTGDSVNAETLAEGTTAHDASGNPIIGKMPTTNVLYTEQTLTEAQKAQARQNIGAVKSTGWTAGKNLGTDENGNIIEKDDIFSKDVSGWHPVECLTGATWTNLGYFWDTAGNLVSTQYTGNYISTTEKIPIVPNCSYVVSGIAGVVTLYDASGKNGVQAVVKDDPNTTYPFETNANQYFMGVSHKPAGIWDETRVSVLRTTISKEEYDAIPTKADSLKSLFGKKIVCFGDSLFGMHRGDDSATAFIAAETGATVYNVGFGGCRMSVHHSSGYAEFSMWALAKAIAENNWSSQDSAASKGSSYFPEQLALLKSIDFSDVDIAVIHYGTNDFGAGNVIAMDNPADHDDYTTLCGALRYSIEKLLGAYPKLRIYVSLPVYRYWKDNGVNTYAETYLNVGGKTLPEFVEALRSTAAEYNLPVIDGYYGLGINKENAPTFLSDGTHHNKAGRERFGRYIGRNLISQQTTGKSGSVSGGNVDLGVTGATVGQTVKISAVDENGKPTEWETVDFPEGGGATTWEDLGSTFEEGVVLAECSPVYVASQGMFTFSEAISLVEGKEYTVNWNGTPYKCTCMWLELDGNVGLGLGNIGMLTGGTNTGEPFLLGVLDSGFTACIPMDGSTSLTISITGTLETINTVPNKYLPTLIVDILSVGGEVTGLSRTVEEITAAYNDGKQIQFRVHSGNVSSGDNTFSKTEYYHLDSIKVYRDNGEIQFEAYLSCFFNYQMKQIGIIAMKDGSYSCSKSTMNLYSLKM